MNCPSCKTDINNNALICPNCKKVLKLQCKYCGNITKKNICEKCGSVLINKCYKCGKLNSTTQTNCPNCGMDINASIGLKESVIEEFAGLTIDFTNLDEIKNGLKSEKLAQKVKNNLYEIIKKTATQKKLRVQAINNTFIIRFCKDISFEESCKSATDFAIYVAQTITDINKKLFDAKGLEIKTQMAILKRDVYASPADYKSGLNINVVYSSSGNKREFNNTEIIVDNYIYQEIKNDYPLQSLSAVYIKNQMIMFFELILTHLIQTDRQDETEAEEIKLPVSIDFEPDESQENELLINFKTLNCTFIYSKQNKLENEFIKIAKKQINTPIISIRSPEELGKLGLIETDKIRTIFKEYKIHRLSCSPLNKYNAYGLFKQLILTYKNLDEIDLGTQPELIQSLFNDQYLKDLFLMQTNLQEHPEDFRYSYFEALGNFLASIPFKTLFVIDDIENADEASIEIIKYIYENNKLENIGFIVSSTLEFVLHRKIYKLMTDSRYFDIQITQSSNKKIVNNDKNRLQKIKDSFYLEKILQNTKGAQFYFEQSMNYLIDSGVCELKNNSYELVSEKMLVIPSDIDNLIQKRILTLKKEPQLFEFYCKITLTGEKISHQRIKSFNLNNINKLLKSLQNRKLIELYNDTYIRITNYNLFRKHILILLEEESAKDIAMDMLNTVYASIIPITPSKAFLLEIADLKKESFAHWHALAMTSSCFGDFCAYLNCTNKFLSLVENVIDENTDKSIDEIKFDVYSELANIMYKYYPDKIVIYLRNLLNDLETKKDTEKIREVANKLLQSCLMSGYYSDALGYLGKIISKTDESNLNPKNKEFSVKYFLLNMVAMEVYFNLGRLDECIDLGNVLFQNLKIQDFKETLLPEEFSKTEFENSVFDAQTFYFIAKILKGQTDIKKELKDSNWNDNSCFKILAIIVDLLEGKPHTEEISTIDCSDKYSKILVQIIYAIDAYQKQDPETFGNYLYAAKVEASIHNVWQAKFFCEAMIGLTYLYIGNTQKAKKIFNNVLKTSEKRGLSTITNLCWYFLTKAELIDNNIEFAQKILNTALINLENNKNSSEILLIMFKTLTCQLVLNFKQNTEQALFLAEQAFDTIEKSKLYIFVPQVANILTHIYNSIINSDAEECIKTQYQQKQQLLNQKLSNI